MVGDVHSIDAGEIPADIIISSLFTHHLHDKEIINFLTWMERTALRGWFINDLYRTRIAYVGFVALAAAARWHHFVRHDGPVSIRRAFVPADWRGYIDQSDISQDEVSIEAHWPTRICVSRIKQP